VNKDKAPLTVLGNESIPGKGTGDVCSKSVFFIVCAVLGILVISQWMSLRMTPEEKLVQGKTISELKEDYVNLEAKNRVLLERNRELTEAFEELEKIGTNDKDLEKILQQEASDARKLAGLETVAGGGIVLTIEPDEAYPVSSNMLIQMVNELKAADAAAITVNGQRLVAMSEIRDTVSGFSVNRVSFSYSDPIIIEALGEGVDLFNALSMVGGVLDKWEESHIDVKVDITDNLIMLPLADWQIEYMNPVVTGDAGEIS
jgi:uncharacterized protein YlxW (UPF0749 family)